MDTYALLKLGAQGLALLVIGGASVLVLRNAYRALQGGSDDRATHLRLVKPQGPMAADSGWGDDGHVRAMRAAEQRAELRRRLQATQKARGPARISGGPVSAA